MADKPGYATDETEGHNIQQISEPPCHLPLPLQLLPENFKFQTQDDKKYTNCKNKGIVMKIKKELHILHSSCDYSTLMITFHCTWNSLWTELLLFQLSGERTWNTFLQDYFFFWNCCTQNATSYACIACVRAMVADGIPYGGHECVFLSSINGILTPQNTFICRDISTEASLQLARTLTWHFSAKPNVMKSPPMF